ncbi:hypothetical protein [Horticoccus sp. 23ND18S-11]|uniref:hypothetical protein n=1 Tax=Horticoccus sp. 23ND18S-11 TaxID=3391832 RepID=UPI0039C928FA
MKRVFTHTLFAVLVALAVGLRAAEPAARVRPDFGVVFNDDADLAFVVPDRAQSEALLRANVSALADTPVKTFVYCLGMGGDLLYYNTKVASPVGWRKSPDETPGSLMEKRMENARVCLAQGADAVRTAGEEAKRLGLRFIPSLRMNDAHFMANPDQHAMTSEFWFKHRERYIIKDSPLVFQKAYGNLLDYTHEAVRQLRYDTVVEALERNRDLVDGFELDFNRFQVFFPQGRAEAGAPLITALIRKVRIRLDQLAAEVKRPLHLFVRVPPSLADCRTAGLEVERWMEEGLVDLVSPAQIMTLAGDMPIADLVALGRRTGVKVYPSLYPRTSWRLPFPSPGPNRYAGAKLTRDATLEEICGAVAGYRAAGVDGFYLFNFYNAFGSARPHDERLYRVFRDAARVENLAGQAKVFAVTKSYYNDGPGSYAYGKQLPAKLDAGGTLRLTLPAAAPTPSPFPVQGCEIRLGVRGLPADATVTVSFNGHGLGERAGAASTRAVTQPITRSAPKPRDAAEVYLHFPVPVPEWVANGENRAVVTVSGAGFTTEITDFELRTDFQNDLEKLWLRVPTILNPP